jgi:hypothetical protein
VWAGAVGGYVNFLRRAVEHGPSRYRGHFKITPQKCLAAGERFLVSATENHILQLHSSCVLSNLPPQRTDLKHHTTHHYPPALERRIRYSIVVKRCTRQLLNTLGKHCPSRTSILIGIDVVDIASLRPTIALGQSKSHSVTTRFRTRKGARTMTRACQCRTLLSTM